MPYMVKELVEYMPGGLGCTGIWYRDLDSAPELFQTEVERAADDEGFFPAGNAFLDPEVLLGDEADRVVAWRAFEHEEGFWWLAKLALSKRGIWVRSRGARGLSALTLRWWLK